ncbi:HNH endonuclease signature motif containing protein [Rhodococcus aerolatus]
MTTAAARPDHTPDDAPQGAPGTSTGPGSVTALRSVEQVGDEVVTLAGQIAAATGRFLRLLADFDAREGWAGPGLASCAHWLSWRCGTDLRTAREHVRVARALTALPRTAAELDHGRLSYSKVRALARVATPGTEDDLVDVALAAPAAHVERLVRGLRTAAAQQDGPAAEQQRREQDREDRRRVQWRWDPETGDLVVWGRLAAQDGAAVLAALTRAEHERTRTDGSAEPPDLIAPPPSDLGPALVAAASVVCDAVAAPAHAVAAEVLLRVDELGSHLQDGPPLEPAAAAELQCGATRRAVVVDAAGRPLGARGGPVLAFGRARRVPSPAQLRALLLRDGGCRAPGCGRTRFLHAHHVVPCSRGGRTDLDNLLLLCGGCHRSLHLGRFTVTALGGQRFELHRDGRPWLAAPGPDGPAEHLADDRVRPDATAPAWHGEPLDVGYATEVLRRAWSAPRTPGPGAA